MPNGTKFEQAELLLLLRFSLIK